jgi:hypothetical protein
MHVHCTSSENDVLLRNHRLSWFSLDCQIIVPSKTVSPSGSSQSAKVVDNISIPPSKTVSPSGSRQSAKGRGQHKHPAQQNRLAKL